MSGTITIPLELLFDLAASAPHATVRVDPDPLAANRDMRVTWRCTSDCPRCAAYGVIQADVAP